MRDQINHINSLIEQADDSSDSADAMRYSQAALNVANALVTLHQNQIISVDEPKP